MRTNMVALFGSAGFSVSVILVFWALIELMRIYLGPECEYASQNTISFLCVDSTAIYWLHCLGQCVFVLREQTRYERG